MERKGKWTRGPVEVELMESGDFDITAVDGPLDTKWGNICGSGSVAKDGREDEAHSNASLIASAFNAATTCEDMGYNGEACVKALPELVAYALHATSILAALGDMPNITNEGIIIVDKCRG